MKNGILIVGHGSRAIDAQNIFNSIVTKLKQKGYQNVKGANMEFASPTINEAVLEFVNEGIFNIKVMPLFLYNGIHIKEDIPEMLEQIKKEHKDLNFEMMSVLGDDDLIIEIIEKRLCYK